MATSDDLPGNATAPGSEERAVLLRPLDVDAREERLSFEDLLTRRLNLNDEIRAGERWQTVGTLCPESAAYKRPVLLVLGLLAWIQILLMLEVGLHLQLLVLMVAPAAGVVLLLRRRWRWGMLFGLGTGIAAIARGALDISRGISIGISGGAWVWLVTPLLLGVLATVLCMLWWLRSAESRPLGRRLLAAVAGEEALVRARRKRTTGRFSLVPFGIPLAVGVVAMPYAAHLVEPLSALAFSVLLGAAGFGLLLYARLVRGASLRTAGIATGHLVQDMSCAAGVFALLVLGAYAAFNLMDATELLLTFWASADSEAAAGAAGEAAAAVARASSGMASESAALDEIVAAGTQWRPWVVAVVAAFGEELAFRGGLYAAMRRRIDPRLAIPLSAIPFALLHFEPYQTAQLAIGGMILAGVYEARRTLWAPIAIHLAWNLLLTALTP